MTQHDPLICSYAEIMTFIEGYIRRAKSLESLIDDLDQGVLEREIKMEVELETSSDSYMTAVERLHGLLALTEARQSLILKTAKLQTEYLNEHKKMSLVVNSIVEEITGEQQEQADTQITQTRKCENPECGKLFVPKAYNSKYCSMKCSSRVRYLKHKGNS